MLAFGHRQEAALALTGTYQPASVLPAVQRQVPCQFLGQRQIYADLDRHPQGVTVRRLFTVGAPANYIVPALTPSRASHTYLWSRLLRH